MKRTILIAVAAACAAMVWQVVGATASKTHDARPFEGVTNGTSTVAPGAGPLINSTGRGNLQALHLGRGTYEIQATQDYGRHVEAEPDHLPGNNCAFVNGTITLRAANGDQVNGDIDGDRSVACVDQETPGPGPDARYLSTLYVEVTGGSGRFADASGYFFSRGTSTFTGIGATGATFDDRAVLFGDIDY